MAEKGLVLSHDPGTYTTKKSVAGRRPRVLHISGSLIYPGIMGNMGNMGTGQLKQAFSLPRSSAEHGQDVQEYGQRPALQGADDAGCPYSVPMKSGRIEETWAENEPESLAVQGPAHIAHDAHEMGDNSPHVFSASEATDEDPTPTTHQDSRPCLRCGGRRFWVSIVGNPICARCHPPGPGDRVLRWIGDQA